MEPLEQNAYLLAFFNYVVAKLTKNRLKNRPSCTKSMEQCLKKVVFFSPENVLNEVFNSLRKLHCWIANRLKYTNPLEQNWDRVLEKEKWSAKVDSPILSHTNFLFRTCQINQLIFISWHPISARTIFKGNPNINKTDINEIIAIINEHTRIINTNKANIDDDYKSLQRVIATCSHHDSIIYQQKYTESEVVRLVNEHELTLKKYDSLWEQHETLLKELSKMEKAHREAIKKQEDSQAKLNKTVRAQSEAITEQGSAQIKLTKTLRSQSEAINET